MFFILKFNIFELQSYNFRNVFNINYKGTDSDDVFE